jgi:hypothetical protein
LGPELFADGFAEDTVPGAPPIDQIQGEVILAKWHNEPIEDNKLPRRSGGQAVPLSSA